MSKFAKLVNLKYERSPYFDKFFDKRDSSKQKHYWNTSHPDLKPTPNECGICLFCGTKAEHIQAGLARHNHEPYGPCNKSCYDTTGYSCTCVHAATWLQVQQELEDLTAKYKKDKESLEKKLPKTSNILLKVLKSDYDIRELVVDLLSNQESKNV